MRGTGLGIVYALLAAFLFGISPVLTKDFVSSLSPVFVAGLLYLGSGIGLVIARFVRRKTVFQGIGSLSKLHTIKLLGAILSGGILAPICLVYGLKYASAFEVSLLLNLESLATTLIAWMIFKEHIGKAVWAGKPLILLGALLIVLPINQAMSGLSISIPALAVAASCLLWGLDNNFTRDVDELPASVLAMVKGLVAGVFNLGLSLGLSHSVSPGISVLILLLVGAVCYGASLVFFVEALRRIGSARTSTFFAVGPFFGMLAAVLLLGERPAGYQWAAGTLMLIGIWILYREDHSHEHHHEAITHEHLHTHDDGHHQHSHDGSEGEEPHGHFHSHGAEMHSHSHLPDIHHRHGHG